MNNKTADRKDNPLTLYDILDLIHREAQSHAELQTLSGVRSRFEKIVSVDRVPVAPETETSPPLSLLGDWAARRRDLTKELRDGRWDQLSADFWTVVGMIASSDHDGYREFYSLLSDFRTLNRQVVARVRLSLDSDVSLDNDRLETPCEAEVVQLLPENGYYLLCCFPSAVAPDGRSSRYESFFMNLEKLYEYAEATFDIPRKAWTSGSEGAVKPSRGNQDTIKE